MIFPVGPSAMLADETRPFADDSAKSRGITYQCVAIRESICKITFARRAQFFFGDNRIFSTRPYFNNFAKSY